MRSSVRALLAILTSGLALAPGAAHAQQTGKVYRIGHAAAVDFDQLEQGELRQWSAFVQSLRSFGWIEGKNFVFDRRLAITSSDLPIGQPTTFELICNLKTAKASGRDGPEVDPAARRAGDRVTSWS